MNPQINYLLNQSIQLILTNKLDDAENSLSRILKMQPKHSDALCFRSVVEAYRFNFSEALKWIEKSIEANPKNAVAYSNRGNILKDLGRFKEALASYERAIALAPSYEEAHNNKGNALQDLKRFVEAVKSYEKAITLTPQYAEAHNNKGNALQKLHRFEDALESYRTAISLKPSYALAWTNMGLAFGKLKKIEEAMHCHDKALAIDPTCSEAWSNKGILFFNIENYVSSIECFDQAIIINHEFASAWADRASALDKSSRYDEALANYERAYELRPATDFLADLLIRTKLKIGNWDGLQQEQDRIKNILLASEMIFEPFIALSFLDDPNLHLKIASMCSSVRHPNRKIFPEIERRPHKKIRIGYFSADLWSHPVALLTAELFELHDRSQFEIYAFSLRNGPAGDLLRPRLEKAFDQFLRVENKTDQEVVALARELEIDIAIDLGGHTEFSPIDIFSYRVAPIQVSWLGYPGTTGTEYMDYILADKTLIPESSRQFFAEKIAYLPDSYMVDDSKRTASLTIFSKRELGLPEDKFIYCCFNNSYKFNQKILESWARILLKAKDSVLWISENNPFFKDNIVKEFAKLDILSTRIIFAQRVDSMADHLARYALADLFLDTLPFNAHSTALDALKAGVPLITCIGEAFPGRVAASLLNAIDLTELIANDMGQYEAMAIDFALNSEKLRAIKEKLSRNRSSSALFNTQLFTKNIEAAYSEMYQRYLADLPVEHISV
ncbi:Predicted O-linked N-acetylglucosamine transferase, SPINDLY family [Polynucleobacter meluiroseus]|uniref:protein O-GlcNAc transferase n=1 Tax=Polynucleobacter meluiroseus TaxID=1938814 RepID=A0A240E099_9BURK|nr:tetratricopeptide repeat protein [Polynucleobacter meluiroseus]SNX27941.1 Predicted O-linked N-acetylglucosamine transferase, SPINDLY family [Polynucleobacter meluiroseus]